MTLVVPKLNGKMQTKMCFEKKASEQVLFLHLHAISYNLGGVSVHFQNYFVMLI